jgi:hypothetical protein
LAVATAQASIHDGADCVWDGLYSIHVTVIIFPMDTSVSLFKKFEPSTTHTVEEELCLRARECFTDCEVFFCVVGRIYYVSRFFCDHGEDSTYSSTQFFNTLTAALKWDPLTGIML